MPVIHSLRWLTLGKTATGFLGDFPMGDVETLPGGRGRLRREYGLVSYHDTPAALLADVNAALAGMVAEGPPA